MNNYLLWSIVAIGLGSYHTYKSGWTGLLGMGICFLGIIIHIIWGEKGLIKSIMWSTLPVTFSLCLFYGLNVPLLNSLFMGTFFGIIFDLAFKIIKTAIKES